MKNSDQDTDGPISFYDRYSTFSDSQIKEILKNQKNYQEPAVTAAVKIAIERELIHTEQDLLGPEYQTKPKIGLSLFPEITDGYQYKKLVASIFRVLYFLSLFPIIFGVLKYAEGQLNMTFLGVGIGLVWLILTYLLFKTKKMLFAVFQIGLLTLIFIGISYNLVIQPAFQLTDMVILVSGMVISLYLLLFLMNLIKLKHDQLSDH